MMPYAKRLNQKYFPSAAKTSASAGKKQKKEEHPWDKFMALWRLVTYSKTPRLYEEQYTNLKAFLATRPAALAYLEKWIIPFKEQFVVPWACQYPHLRNLNTSRVESGHAYLKTFITNSTGDILSVFNSLLLAVDAQINQIHESIGKDTIKTLISVPKPFIAILGKISTFAIKQSIEQFDLLKNLNPTEPCSETLTKGIGIPCAHKIAETLESGRMIMPEDFHLQWHLRYNPEVGKKDALETSTSMREIKKLTAALGNEPPRRLATLFEQIHQPASGTHTVVPIQAPAIKQKPKGRPRNKKQAKKSTKRDPSAFEIVEAELKKQQSQKKRVAKPQKQPKRRSKRVKQNNDENEDVDDDNDEDSPEDESEENDSDTYQAKYIEASTDSELTDDEEKAPESKVNIEKAPESKANIEKAPESKVNIKKAPESEANIENAPESKANTSDVLIKPNKAIYLNQIPEHLRMYIEDVFNPIGDGNCGFHCISKALGYDGKDGWLQVREEMINEIANHKNVYSKLQGGEAEINRILEALKVTGPATKAMVPAEKWLNKLEHGQIIANTYTHPVIFLSSLTSSSFLPLCLGPQNTGESEPIYLLHVNGNHWVMPTIEGINGVKPIPPPMLAKRFSSKSAKTWVTFLKQGLDLYQQGLHC
ncbi:hypothetical protein PTTG_28027 [Puccinia triticina 1-1 BBBD Race 1]|uniref:OTU domain-containing protein n=1 Tax=Puccinia triticina (isolate 1-1 / race 1 (BBBD)) TaxID=630390 RepID=A0A180GF11_PUCT1|nr:hypothetical protein PTTG_28027 [Puccinia triticina 1-1 BBBD Race 1]